MKCLYNLLVVVWNLILILTTVRVSIRRDCEFDVSSIDGEICWCVLCVWCLC